MEGFRAGRDTVSAECPRDPLAVLWRWLGRGERSEKSPSAELNRAEGSKAHIQKTCTSH